jgi:hypothetical protein
MDVQQVSRFADRVLRLLERVEYRRADSPADKTAIYRLRYDAYLRAGTIEPRPSGMFHDALDETNNAWLIGVFIDGELASALRLHISANLSDLLPTRAPFPDILEPLLSAGNLIIDVTRFVAKLDFSQTYSDIPYLRFGRHSWQRTSYGRLHHRCMPCRTSGLLSTHVWRSALVGSATISSFEAAHGAGRPPMRHPKR